MVLDVCQATKAVVAVAGGVGQTIDHRCYLTTGVVGVGYIWGGIIVINIRETIGAVVVVVYVLAVGLKDVGNVAQSIVMGEVTLV